jgi:hypothetical protein
VRFKSLQETVDATSPGGRLVFPVFAAQLVGKNMDWFVHSGRRR